MRMQNIDCWDGCTTEMIGDDIVINGVIWGMAISFNDSEQSTAALLIDGIKRIAKKRLETLKDVYGSAQIIITLSLGKISVSVEVERLLTGAKDKTIDALNDAVRKMIKGVLC